MDNYYVPVENRKNQNHRGKMFLNNMVISLMMLFKNIIMQTARVIALLIRTTFNCILAILFINPYPKWK
jgi:hypothetical protein